MLHNIIVANICDGSKVMHYNIKPDFTGKWSHVLLSLVRKGVWVATSYIPLCHNAAQLVVVSCGR